MRCDAASSYLFINGHLHSTADPALFNSLAVESVYEVIKLLAGIPLFFEDHMDRLRRSLALKRMNTDISNRRVRKEIDALVRKTGCQNINVKLVWHPNTEESTFLTYLVQQDLPAKDAYQKGVHTIVISGERKNPHVKSIGSSFLERAKSAREAVGAYEALLMVDEGYILEGTRSNLFYIIDDQLYTPPSGSVLLGVTRQHVLAICRDISIQVKHKMLHRKDLHRLDGAFITGTTIDVLPIGSIEHVKLTSPSHPTIGKIARAFEIQVAEYVARHR